MAKKYDQIPFLFQTLSNTLKCIQDNLISQKVFFSILCTTHGL